MKNPLLITTPQVIADPIRAYCQKVANAEPVFVPVRPTVDAKILECFPNVYRFQEGTPQHGWLIWECGPGLYIKLEEHCVTRIAGSLVDITPQMDGEDQILFLPDDTVQRPANGFRCRAARYHSLIEGNSTRDEIVSIEEALDSRHDGKPQYELVGKADLAAANEMINRRNELALRLKRSSLFVTHAPNLKDPCACGSGKKYKNCCRKKGL